MTSVGMPEHFGSSTPNRANLRHRFSQAMVRSTIQRLGRTTNLSASDRLTTSILNSARTSRNLSLNEISFLRVLLWLGLSESSSFFLSPVGLDFWSIASAAVWQFNVRKWRQVEIDGASSASAVALPGGYLEMKPASRHIQLIMQYASWRHHARAGRGFVGWAGGAAGLRPEPPPLDGVCITCLAFAVA